MILKLFSFSICFCYCQLTMIFLVDMCFDGPYYDSSGRRNEMIWIFVKLVTDVAFVANATLCLNVYTLLLFRFIYPLISIRWITVLDVQYIPNCCFQKYGKYVDRCLFKIIVATVICHFAYLENVWWASFWVFRCYHFRNLQHFLGC